MPHPTSLLRLLWNGPDAGRAVAGMRNQRHLAADEHLRLCGDWLLTTRRHARDGGYAAFFSLLRGWSHGYVETTGYIIPTMLDIAAALHDPKYRTDALEAAEWLLTAQLPNGAFPDLDRQFAEVFDTGQVLIGLTRLIRETKAERFALSAARAGEWLVSVQQPNGAWRTQAGAERTYQSRTAAALIECGQALNRPEFVAAGHRALDWILAEQTDNGFFQNCELGTVEGSLLHTLVYVLEGLLAAYETTGQARYLDAVLKSAESLKQINLTRDLILYSHYRADWTASATDKCVTGLAQWAGLCGRLYELTGDADYRTCGLVSLYYVQSKQIQSGASIRGALPASVPLWGNYHPYAFVNWGVKFFADALLRFRPHNIPLWRQQETYVSQCFRLQEDSGRWADHAMTLDVLDEAIMERVAALTKAHASGRPLRVLDLGCGEGRCVNWLARRFPDFQCFGADPNGGRVSEALRKGSAYEVPFEDQSFDVVFTYITLQHTSELDRVFSEIRRVLRPEGLCIIADRHPISAKGFMKPWHELKGRWMYRWDSPFRERWHRPSTWKRTMQAEGFENVYLETVSNPTDRGIRRLLKTNRFLVIAGRLTTKPVVIPPAPPTAELKEADSVLIHGPSASAPTPTSSEPHAQS